MNEIIVTRNSISRKNMTIRVSPRTGGVDVASIEGKHLSLEQFNDAWEREISGKKPSKLQNFIPLTREGATLLRDALTKVLEAE